MTPFYLQTDTEADMWAALTELGFVSEHEGDWHPGRETTEDC